MWIVLPLLMVNSETLRDVLRRIRQLDSRQFEHLCKIVVSEVEEPEKIETTQEVGDGGVDVLGTVGREFYSGEFGIEAKSYSDPVGVEIVRDFYAALQVNGCRFGTLITTSSFTSGAVELTKESGEFPMIRLVTGEELAKMMVENNVGVRQSDEESEDSYAIDVNFWSQFDKFEDELIPSAGVPQADSMDRLNIVLQSIDKGYQYSPQITDYLIRKTDKKDWKRRQANYYTRAAYLLGLADMDEGEFDGRTMRKWVLTREGHLYLETLDKNPDEARNELRELMKDIEIIELVLEDIKEEGTVTTHSDIKDIIQNKTGVTGDTVNRRAGTIGTWLDEIKDVAIRQNGEKKYDYIRDVTSDWS